MMGSHNPDEAHSQLDEPASDSSSPSFSIYKSALTDHPLAFSDSPQSPPLDSPPPESNPREDAFPPPETTTSTSDSLTISVSDPRKEGESGGSINNNSFVTYLITTETDLPDYGGSKFTVRRRFKDIVTLSDRLIESYRGFFIPPRPDKSVVERQVMQKQEFVEQRRVALERYLRRLAAHPMIRKSDELRVFLCVEGRMPLPTSADMASRMLDGAMNLPKQLVGAETGAAVADVVQPAKSGRDLMRMFKELKQTVAMDWGGAKPPVEEEDKDFLEKKDRLNQLELHLTNASKQLWILPSSAYVWKQECSQQLNRTHVHLLLYHFQAESLVKAQQQMGETMGELGLAFIKLSKFETEQGTSVTQRNRATDMKSIATTAVKAGRLYRGLNARSAKHLDTLHEYMGLMLAVQGAFSDRSSALLTAQTLISELSSLNAKAEKLETGSSTFFGGDKSKPRKMEELKEAIKVTEDAKCCALKEYERIKENNRSEIERLDKERKADFMSMLKGFVTNQVAYAEKIETEWAKVAEETSRYAK